MTEDFIQEYVAWIKQSSLQTPIKENLWKIVTPFLDNHHDLLEIYIKKVANGRYRLSDDSYTVRDLGAYGFDINTPKRKELFDFIIRGYGVRYDEETHELFAEASAHELGQRKNDFLQCIISIGALLQLKKDLSDFLSTVKDYLDENEIPYHFRPRAQGKYLEHTFDFSVVFFENHARVSNYIDVLNFPKRTHQVESILFRFQDVKDSESCRGIIISNNENGTINSKYDEKISALELITIPWTEKETLIPYLKPRA